MSENSAKSLLDNTDYMSSKDKNTTRRGVVYCRVSSHEQVQGTSLESQKQACLDYAKREGIEVSEDGVLIERGESATAANRTELIKVLEYCRQHEGEVSAFIVWKIDRFARNTTDHYSLRAQLAKYGVRLHSVTEPISDDPMGRMTEGILSSYAQFENDIRKQRCEGGMRSRIEQGIWPWQPPIGYVNAKKLNDRRKLRPDEPDAERFYLAQKAFRTYATGKHSATAVVELLNKWGFKTRTGRPMRKQLFERMLKDPFYAGVLTDPWTNKQYKGLHRAMISWDEYEQIQAIKSGFSRHLNRPRNILNPDFPLRRFVLCSCGGKLTGSWHKGRNKKYASYHCHNKLCEHHAHNVPKDVLEGKFLELLKEVTPKDEFLALFEAVVLDVWKNRKALSTTEREGSEKELKRLCARKEQLVQMRMNDEISKEEFASLKNSIDNQITGFKISQNESLADELDMEAVITFTMQFIRNVSGQWQEMDVRQKQRLQKLVLPQGVTYNKTAGAFGTAVLSPVFRLSQQFSAKKSDLVAGAGIAPATFRLCIPLRLSPLHRICGLDYTFSLSAEQKSGVCRLVSTPFP